MRVESVSSNVGDAAAVRACCGRVEAHRALELLEEYHSRLTHPHDRPLRLAIERIMRIFKSRLFQALVGQYLCSVMLRLAFSKVCTVTCCVNQPPC